MKKYTLLILVLILNTGLIGREKETEPKLEDFLSGMSENEILKLASNYIREKRLEFYHSLDICQLSSGETLTPDEIEQCLKTIKEFQEVIPLLYFNRTAQDDAYEFAKSLFGTITQNL